MNKENDKKLYIVHLGFYDQETNFGVYESHTNVFVVASNPREAKELAKNMPCYRDKKMHTDGIQEINVVQGYKINLVEDKALEGQTKLGNVGYEALHPKSPLASGTEG